jgi:hypothetical protein
MDGWTEVIGNSTYFGNQGRAWIQLSKVVSVGYTAGTNAGVEEAFAIIVSDGTANAVVGVEELEADALTAVETLGAAILLAQGS